LANDLADLIATLRARHRHALDADLCKLRVQHGNVAVAEAMRLLDQRELRTALSASADRHRRNAARLADAELQALFAKKAER
jgi:hypothetical protein